MPLFSTKENDWWYQRKILKSLARFYKFITKCSWSSSVSNLFKSNWEFSFQILLFEPSFKIFFPLAAEIDRNLMTFTFWFFHFYSLLLKKVFFWSILLLNSVFFFTKCCHWKLWMIEENLFFYRIFLSCSSFVIRSVFLLLIQNVDVSFKIFL